MLTPLDARSVTLLEGPFAAARDRNLTYLRSLDPLRLLNGFYENAGLPTRGEAYGGWEQASIAGHSLGHYLSACARLPELADRVALIVEELARCQAARTDGFIGGMPEADRIFGELKAGEVRSSGFDLNHAWVPWYNLHKVFAGLLDVAGPLTPARRGDNGDYLIKPASREERAAGEEGGEERAGRWQEGERALAVATRLGNWVGDVTANLDDDAWQRMLACEHGGMNESLAQLYAHTRDPRHLALAEQFYHRAVLDPLAEGIDCLPGLHGNTQIPKILGCARLYELTGDKKYRAIAENFWRFVVVHHTYCIGGHGSSEHFGPEDRLSERLSNSNCETCNTYNMLRLTRQLASWEPRQAYADFIERALYNHILASQHPETGMLCYFMPLQSGRFKTYSTPDDSFWCCVGTGMENHARYEEYVAAVEEDTLHLTLYTPARIVVPDGRFALTIETNLPHGEDITLTIDQAPPSAYRLVLSTPGWSQAQPGETPASLVRVWQVGEKVTLRFRKEIRTEPLPDNSGRIAFLDGPLVLAADLGPAPAGGKERYNTVIPPVPVLVGTAAPLPGTVPYYQLHDRRYGVYLDRFTPEHWAAQEAEYRAAEAEEHATWTQILDEFWPNQMQAERDHHFAGEKTIGTELSAWKCRIIQDDGWFSFTLRTLPDRPVDLFLKWGPSQQRESTVEVAVEGTIIARPRFMPAPHRHLDQTYPLPEALTQGKEQVTVRVRGADVPLFLARLQKRL